MAELLFTPEEIERFKALQTVLKNDPVSQTQTTGNLHGLNPAGTIALFGAPGVNPRMFQTIINANGSFEKALRFRPSQYIRERVEILTGITASQGTNPSTTCGDGMRPGELKVCMQDYEFGQEIANTNTVSGPDQGLYFTRADVDRELVSDANDFGPFVPDLFTGARNINSQSYKQFRTLAQALMLSNAKVLWQGNRSAAPTGTGSFDFFVKQPDGLDRMIKTGYTDVVSNVACAAADSRVINFNANLTGTSANFGSIVDALTDMFTGIEMDVSGGQGGDGMGYVNNMWAIVIHPRMWRPLTRLWPCAYQTVGCATLNDSAGQKLIINAENQREMQEQMYQGRYLMIDGMRIPVLFSWGISNPNVGLDTYTSSIYIVPFTVGGEDVTYVEYFNHGNEQQEAWYNALNGNPDTRVLNGGFWRSERRMKAGCLEYQFWSRWRLTFRAAFAAGRIDNVTYQDRTRMRSPYIGESYYADGGQTSRGAGSLYSI